MAVTYERVNWVDEPSTDTPLSAENLNKMDEGISELAEWSEDVEESIDERLETKADKDGSYDYLTAGLANQLSTDKGVIDSVPYLMRPSGGVAVGSYEQDKIVGGSVVWNQLIQNGNFADNSGWSGVASNHETLAIDNGIATMTAISNNTAKGITTESVIPYLANHKIFFSVMVNPSADTGVRLGGPSAAEGNYRDASTYATANTWNHINKVLEVASDNTARKINLYLDTGGRLSAGDTVQVKQFYAIDLTAMFGLTIADYIRSLERATAGAGVTWLQQHFPQQFDSGYQEYNSGEIKSVSGLVSHDMTGFNQFDKTKASELGYRFTSTGIGQATSYGSRTRCSDYIKVIPGQEYYFRNVFGRGIMTPVYWYDFDKQFISSAFVGNGQLASGVATAPNNAAYVGVNFETTEIGNVCVNRSNSQNGEYEPYEVHSYPLDSTLTLRGIPKLDANNQLYYDGDTYSADGTVERRYTLKNLGELSWTKDNSGAFYAAFPYRRDVSANTLCDRYDFYMCTTWSDIVSNAPDKTISTTSASAQKYVVVKDSAYTDASTFITAMNSVYALFELAEPTTEQAASYQTPQLLDPDGTEEYVLSDGAFPLPVGHETFYPMDLKKKIENLPDSVVEDVQVDGVSVVQNGVANVPQGSANVFGVFKEASDAEIKAGQAAKVITANSQFRSAFYGLAKAAGDTTQSASANAVGAYTDEAKKAIRKMLGIPNMTSELISEITTAEDLERVEIATDANGLPFALRACKIYVKLPASTTGVSDFITAQYRAVDINDDAVVTSFPTIKMTAASGSLLTYEFESFPGGMYFVRAFASSNFGSSSGQMISMQYDKLIKYTNRIILKPYSQATTLIPAGTIIKLYGIRYDD